MRWDSHAAQRSLPVETWPMLEQAAEHPRGACAKGTAGYLVQGQHPEMSLLHQRWRPAATRRSRQCRWWPLERGRRGSKLAGCAGRGVMGLRGWWRLLVGRSACRKGKAVPICGTRDGAARRCLPSRVSPSPAPAFRNPVLAHSPYLLWPLVLHMLHVPGRFGAEATHASGTGGVGVDMLGLCARVPDAAGHDALTARKVSPKRRYVADGRQSSPGKLKFPWLEFLNSPEFHPSTRFFHASTPGRRASKLVPGAQTMSAAGEFQRPILSARFGAAPDTFVPRPRPSASQSPTFFSLFCCNG